MIVLDINQTNGKYTETYVEDTVKEIVTDAKNFITTKYGGYYVCDGITVEMTEESETNNGFVMGDTGLVVLGYRSTLLMSKPNILGLLELNLIYILNSYKPNEK